MVEHLAARAYRALALTDPDEKCAQVAALQADWLADRVPLAGAACVTAYVADVPGRPARPNLVDPRRVPRRTPTTREGHAALIHAICHIEFNAINLALDCCCRFTALPRDFHHGWLRVAAEEAYHFGLVRARLHALGFDYGDFDAHDGLWQMALKTAHDPLARMALVPRVLEARGLDATPPIRDKLAGIGDADTVAVLDIIERDEVGHVKLGDTWFRILCEARGLAPEPAFRELLAQFQVAAPQPPFNTAARLAAGFSPEELAAWSAMP